MVDAKFGTKREAARLLWDWVERVGAPAGIEPSKSRVLAGTFGEAETRLELELGFWSLAEAESCFAAIDSAKHKEWAERFQEVIQGSPQWRILNAMPKESAQPPAGSSAQVDKKPGEVILDHQSSERPEEGEGVGTGESSTESSQVEEQSSQAAQGQSRVIRDWKGDMLRINPGDILPGL